MYTNLRSASNDGGRREQGSESKHFRESNAPRHWTVTADAMMAEYTSNTDAERRLT